MTRKNAVPVILCDSPLPPRSILFLSEACPGPQEAEPHGVHPLASLVGALVGFGQYESPDFGLW